MAGKQHLINAFIFNTFINNPEFLFLFFAPPPRWKTQRALASIPRESQGE